MLKRFALLALVFVSVAAGTTRACSGVSVTLFAQSLPSVKHAVWAPNAAAQNVTQYTLTLDNGAPVVVPVSACTATLCTANLSIPTFGNHVAAVTAQNLALSTDPTSLQSSPAATIAFSLNQAPAAVTSGNVTN